MDEMKKFLAENFHMLHDLQFDGTIYTKETPCEEEWKEWPLVLELVQNNRQKLLAER